MNSLLKISILSVFVALAQSKAVLKSAPTNCEGYEDADFVVIGGNSPDTIPIPGEISMDINQLIKVDLPSDMVIKMDLTKLEPFPLLTPQECMSITRATTGSAPLTPPAPPPWRPRLGLGGPGPGPSTSVAPRHPSEDRGRGRNLGFQ